MIFLSRFMPGLRLPTYFAAGVLREPTDHAAQLLDPCLETVELLAMRALHLLDVPLEPLDALHGLVDPAALAEPVELVPLRLERVALGKLSGTFTCT